MAFSSCLCHPLTIKIDCLEQPIRNWRHVAVDQRLTSTCKSRNIETFGRPVAGIGAYLRMEWSFIAGSRVLMRPQIATFICQHKGFRAYASYMFVFLGTIASYDIFPTTFSGMSGPQLASTMFTLGTAAVLPFYTLMVFAPKAELTKKSMESSIPYVVLGVIYAYLLFLSWTPDTLRLMFASKYWLPELPGIAKMFSSEITLASAWIHLLAVDLFAARHVFQDGLHNEIETRHSVSLCLLFCPIGILTHVITKALTKSS